MELSVHEAAARLSISEATVRRRIRKGELRAVKRPIPTGYEWRVIIGDHPPVTTGDQGVIRGAHGVVTPDQPGEPHQPASNTPADQPAVSPADQAATTSVPAAAFERVLEENRRLHSETMQLAGQLGFVQAQLQQAQERIRLLEAPKADVEPESEPAPTPPAETLPWWERIGRWIRARRT